MSNLFNILTRYSTESFATPQASRPVILLDKQETDELSGIRVALSEQDTSEAVAETVMGVSDGVNRIGSTVNEIVERKGGLSIEAFKMLNVAVSSLNGILTIEQPQNNFSLESYNESKIGNIALEGIADTAKSIWDKFVKFVTSVWNRLKSFVKLLFSAKARMKRNVELAKKAVKEVGSGGAVDHTKMTGLVKHIGDIGIERIGGDVSKFVTEAMIQLENLDKVNELGIEYTQIDGDLFKSFKNIGDEVMNKQYIDVAKRHSPIVGGLVLAKRTNKVLVNDLTVYPSTSVMLDYHFTKPVVKNVPTLKGAISVGVLSSGLEEMYEHFVKFIEYNTKFEVGLKSYADSIRVRQDAYGFEDGKIGPDEMAKKVFNCFNFVNPAKYSGKIISLLNGVAKLIIANASKESGGKIDEVIEDVIIEEIDEKGFSN